MRILPRRNKWLALRPRLAAPHCRQEAFALLVLLVILTLAALTALTGMLTPLQARARQTATTQQALQQAKEALIAYAATYRDRNGDKLFGYLPCPDTQAQGTQTKGNGLADNNCGNVGETVVGLLPFRTLGLPDMRDATGNCLWYVVSGNFKSNSASMNWDSQGQIALQDGKGAPLAAPDDINGGVAAAVIAPGPALAGQVRTANGSNTCTALPSEITAYLDGSYHFPSGATLRLTQGEAASTSNNDLIVTLSPKEIFTRVMARGDFKNSASATPPGQINSLNKLIKIALEQKIQNDYTSASAAPSAATQPAQQAGYSQFVGKLIGNLPALTLTDANYDTYLANWSDQYRYVICSKLDTTCLSVTGTACRGALLFGGRATNGGPRPSSQKPPSPLPAPPNTYLNNYFENPGALPLLNSGTFSFSGSTEYSAASPVSDVATCLFPGSFLSFSKDLGNRIVATAFPGTPLVSVNTSSKTVTLGNPTASSSASACFWINKTFGFSQSLRVYFRFQIQDVGEGFTFVVADGTANNPASTAPIACGDQGDALGYSGNGIRPPKFALEFDAKATASRNDPSASHVAILYWGTTASTADDNTHNAGTAGSGAQPLNPRSLTPAPAGIANLKTSDPNLPYSGWAALLNTTVHVRLDVNKAYDAASHSARYTLRAYVADHFGGGINAGTCTSADMADLSQNVVDMPCTKTPTVEQDEVKIDDIGMSEAFTSAFAGFTVGQDPTNASRQQVLISNFLLRSE